MDATDDGWKAFVVALAWALPVEIKKKPCALSCLLAEFLSCTRHTPLAACYARFDTLPPEMIRAAANWLCGLNAARAVEGALVLTPKAASETFVAASRAFDMPYECTSCDLKVTEQEATARAMLCGRCNRALAKTPRARSAASRQCVAHLRIALARARAAGAPPDEPAQPQVASLSKRKLRNLQDAHKRRKIAW